MKDTFNDEVGITEEEMTTKIEEAKAERVASTALEYRYVCIACTGIAYYTNGANTSHPVGQCKNCGAQLGNVDQTRFIALTENEKEQLAAQK